jgi:hypothetical protein
MQSLHNAPSGGGGGSGIRELWWCRLVCAVFLAGAGILVASFLRHGSVADNGIEVFLTSQRPTALSMQSSPYPYHPPVAPVIHNRHLASSWLAVVACLWSALYQLVLCIPGLNRWYLNVRDRRFNPFHWLFDALISYTLVYWHVALMVCIYDTHLLVSLMALGWCHWLLVGLAEYVTRDEPVFIDITDKLLAGVSNVPLVMLWLPILCYFSAIQPHAPWYVHVIIGWILLTEILRVIVYGLRTRRLDSDRDYQNCLNAFSIAKGDGLNQAELAYTLIETVAKIGLCLLSYAGPRSFN